jgi:hypothetical protein
MSNEKMHKTQSEHGFRDEVLLGIYSALKDIQLDFNERKWETIRVATTLILGVLVGIGGLAASQMANSRLVFAFLGLSLLVLGTAVSIWTVYNVRRESKLQFEVDLSMFQIEKLLGVHKEIPEEFRWLPPYKYIFGIRHLDNKYHINVDPKEFENYPVGAWVNARAKRHVFMSTVGNLAFIMWLICAWVGIILLIIAIWGPNLQATAIRGTPTP